MDMTPGMMAPAPQETFIAALRQRLHDLPPPASVDLAALRQDMQAARAEVAALQEALAATRSETAVMTSELGRLRDGQAIYLGENEALTRLHNGLRIYVDTRDVGICSHLMLEGRWEPWIEALLAAHTKPGMSFVDVGANFGYYTLNACLWVGAAGRVHAFEANPGIFRRLRKSVSVNGFDGTARLHGLAAWSKEAALHFAFQHEFSGGGGLCGTEDDGAWQRQSATVAAAPLDAVLADLPEAHVMKVDVEGAEPEVIAGAEALLARSPHLALLLEFRAGAVADPLDWLRGFQARGFRLALAEPEGLIEADTPEAVLATLSDRLGNLFLRRG